MSAPNLLSRRHFSAADVSAQAYFPSDDGGTAVTSKFHEHRDPLISMKFEALSPSVSPLTSSSPP